MDAKDLMIGDWVKHPVYVYVKIEELGTTFCSSDDYFMETAALQPIPITHDFLDMNDFEYDESDNIYYNDYLSEDGTPLYIEPSGDSFEIVVMGVITEIRYVHEFQHALRMCKIKKEIRLC